MMNSQNNKTCDVVYGANPMALQSTVDVYGDLFGDYTIGENGYLESNGKFYIRQYYIDNVTDNSLHYADYLVDINDVYILQD